MKINLSWRSPIYCEEYAYSKRKVVKRIISPCRKNLLLSVNIKGLSIVAAEAVLERLMQELGGVFSRDNLLSNQEWGIAPFYDAITQTYTDSFCIPKDFDNLEMQKKEIMRIVRQQARITKHEDFVEESQISEDVFAYEVRP